MDSSIFRHSHGSAGSAVEQCPVEFRTKYRPGVGTSSLSCQGQLLHHVSGQRRDSARRAEPIAFADQLSGANPGARIAGEVPQDSKSNYFIGNDPGKWHTAVPNFARVRYAEVYPGIDLIYYGKDGSLDYDWIVSPGADPRKIRMIFDPADRLRIDKHGDLVIQVEGQVDGGREE